MGMTFLQTFVGKNDDFVPQSIIFSLVQQKYHYFTQKLVEMPHCSIKVAFSFYLKKFPLAKLKGKAYN